MAEPRPGSPLDKRLNGARMQDLINEHNAWIDSVGWRNKSPLEQLALVCSEIGEAANECRGEKPTNKLGEELADICLRVFALASEEGIDLVGEIERKIAKNWERGTRGRIK